jgi:putative acetyltransferase
VYLETGSMAEFAPARALYTRYGFAPRGPFADYVEDENSVFMEKDL